MTTQKEVRRLNHGEWLVSCYSNAPCIGDFWEWAFSDMLSNLTWRCLSGIWWATHSASPTAGRKFTYNLSRGSGKGA